MAVVADSKHSHGAHPRLCHVSTVNLSAGVAPTENVAAAEVSAVARRSDLDSSATYCPLMLKFAADCC